MRRRTPGCACRARCSTSPRSCRRRARRRASSSATYTGVCLSNCLSFGIQGIALAQGTCDEHPHLRSLHQPAHRRSRPARRAAPDAAARASASRRCARRRSICLALATRRRDLRSPAASRSPTTAPRRSAAAAAFVAKADDPTAIDYNPAGLAVQRGTRCCSTGTSSARATRFQRFGAFPDSPQRPGDAVGRLRLPAASRTQAGPFFAPFLAATTDFGTFDWLTVAIGVFGPSGVGNRTYPLGVQGAPRRLALRRRADHLDHRPAHAVGRREGRSTGSTSASACTSSTASLRSDEHVVRRPRRRPDGPVHQLRVPARATRSRASHATGTSWARHARRDLAQPDADCLVRPERPDAHLHSTANAATVTVLRRPSASPSRAPGHATLEHRASLVLARSARATRSSSPTASRRATSSSTATYETWSRAQGDRTADPHRPPRARRAQPSTTSTSASPTTTTTRSASVRAAPTTRGCPSACSRCGSAPTTTSPRPPTTPATRASTSTRSTRSPARWAWASSGTASSST